MSSRSDSTSSKRSASSKGSPRARRVLVAHQRSGVWGLLVAEAASPDGRKARVLEATAVSGDLAGVVTEMTERHRPDATIGVLTSGDAVCRAVEVPEGHDAELADASALLADAELPPSISSYRKVGGTVPLPASPGFRTALLVGWPDRSDPADQPVPWTSWSAEMVGLAELLLVARVGGAGGPRAVASLDRQNGCIGAVGAGVDAYAIRTVLEDASEPESFEDAADRCLRGLGQKINAGSVPAAGLNRSLLLDADSRGAIATSVAGARDDNEWFDSFGVALGVACAALRSGLASAALFDLRTTPPTVKRGGVERVLLALQRPRSAAALLAAGLVLALLLPLLISYLHLNGLRSRIAEAESFLAESAPVIAVGSDEDGEPLAVLTLKEQLALYSELDRTRVPMAKLLADLSAGLPAMDRNRLTLVREIRITAPEDFNVRGVVDSLALIYPMTTALRDSEVFSGVSAQETQSVGASGSQEFVLQGKIRRPFFGARYPSEMDYAEQNLAEKIYGEEGAEVWRAGAPLVSALTRTDGGGARFTSASSPGRTVSNADRTPPRSRSGSSSAGESDSGTEVASAGGGSSDARTERRDMFQGGSRSGGEETPPPIPEALSDEQIAALGQQEAMREMVNRRRASGQEGIADDVKRRLEEEVTKLRNRAREAQQSGGGA